MIALLLFAAALVVLPNVSESAVALYPKEDKPAKYADLEGCYLSSLDRVIGYGETFYDVGKECASYKCNENGLTQKSTCGVIAETPGFNTTPEDISKPYPDCCPQIMM